MRVVLDMMHSRCHHVSHDKAKPTGTPTKGNCRRRLLRPQGGKTLRFWATNRRISCKQNRTRLSRKTATKPRTESIVIAAATNGGQLNPREQIVSSETYLVEVNTDGLRCATGFDGQPKCGHFHEYRQTRWLTGDTVAVPVCGLFGYQLKRYESERVPVVARCGLCLEKFGSPGRAAEFERFDVPLTHLTERPRRDTDPAPPPAAIRPSAFAHPTLRAVDSPTHGTGRR